MLKSIVAGIAIFLAGLFGAHPAPSQVASAASPATGVNQSYQQQSSQVTASSTAATRPNSQPTTIINQPVIEHIIERAIPFASSGITSSELDARLQELTGIFSTQLAGIAAVNAAASNNFVTVPVFAQAGRIDNLANVTITNAIVHGVSGLTAADIPSLPYLSTSGGTLTGDVSLTNATSTNFFATLGHFTTGIIDTLTSTAATITNLIATTITGTNATFINATTTNATSTNFFATTASSTNLFAQTASLGTLSAGMLNLSGLATFANGLISQASSTIGNGTQVGGLTISGGATTTGNAYFAGGLSIATTPINVFTTYHPGNNPGEFFSIESKANTTQPGNSGTHLYQGDQNFMISRGLHYDPLIKKYVFDDPTVLASHLLYEFGEVGYQQYITFPCAGSPPATVTISIASPAVVTLNNNCLAANSPVYLTTTDALPTGLTATPGGNWPAAGAWQTGVGTLYYVKTVLDANTFTLSATPGGTAINTSGTQSGTHTLIAGVPVVTTAS